MDKDGLLDKDQIIFLEKKQKEGNSDYYIAGNGENLYDIAQKNGIVLQSLYDFNNLSAADNIYAGTKILLKPASNNYEVSNVKYVEPLAAAKSPGVQQGSNL